MSWFFIALIGPILYACSNHTDKYLILRYLKDGAVGALIIFSSIFSIIALPIVLFIHPSVFGAGLLESAALTINGMLVVAAILLYLYALQKDEASYVVPFYQTIPIFAFILGYFILDEKISVPQGLASVVIMIGALILSFEFDFKKIRFKKNVIFLMLGSSLLYAINGVIFKSIALNEGFWPSIFWGLVGKIILGLAFLAFIAKYRRQFLGMMRENKVAIFSLNSLSESLFLVAEAVMQYATLLAPVALVLLVNSFQPFFVFIIGAALAWLFPKISQESLTKRALAQKFFGIGLMAVGAYFLGTGL